jgi:hypothetical protein
MNAFKDAGHIFRLAAVFVCGILVFVGVRAVLVPKSFAPNATLILLPAAAVAWKYVLAGTPEVLARPTTRCPTTGGAC